MTEQERVMTGCVPAEHTLVNGRWIVTVIDDRAPHGGGDDDCSAGQACSGRARATVGISVLWLL